MMNLDEVIVLILALSLAVIMISVAIGVVLGCLNTMDANAKGAYERFLKDVEEYKEHRKKVVEALKNPPKRREFRDRRQDEKN